MWRDFIQRFSVRISDQPHVAFFQLKDYAPFCAVDMPDISTTFGHDVNWAIAHTVVSLNIQNEITTCRWESSLIEFEQPSNVMYAVIRCTRHVDMKWMLQRICCWACALTARLSTLNLKVIPPAQWCATWCKLLKQNNILHRCFFMIWSGSPLIQILCFQTAVNCEAIARDGYICHSYFLSRQCSCRIKTRPMQTTTACIMGSFMTWILQILTYCKWSAIITSHGSGENDAILHQYLKQFHASSFSSVSSRKHPMFLVTVKSLERELVANCTRTSHLAINNIPHFRD